jgi:hypothetical protein
MSHRISAARRPSSEVFSNLGLGNWLAELQVADLLGHSDQLLDQLAKPMILLQLLLRLVHGGPNRNHTCARLAAYRMRERIARAMPFGALLGTVTR